MLIAERPAAKQTSDRMTDAGHASAARRVVVIGAGPAGLTAAYELTRLGCQPIVVEQNDRVGGLARTENFKGYYFDMGGHRFFTKSRDVSALWSEVLGEDFLLRPRTSRIYYNGKFFSYPLKPLNALASLGPWQGLLILLSYLRWILFPYNVEETFEEWVTNRFGRRLFQIFFKSYTEKVWGIPCSELRAEWAAQRIKDLSVKALIANMFFRPKNVIRTLTEEFHYPRFGPGMMWNAFRRRIEARGGRVQTDSRVVKIHRSGMTLQSIVVDHNGREEVIAGSDFISSMPITEFVRKLEPPAPAEVLEAASRLTYRDFLTVCLVVNKTDLFPDNWIYVHDPRVKVGRIQNFKNWNADMVPDAATTSLGLEYFCNAGDALWTMTDEALIEQAKHELEHLGLARYSDVADGCVFRVPHAYPVYDSGYRAFLDTLKEFVASFHNFQTIGRNGLHRYNNQDHAMITGIWAARNLALGEANDVWQVNADNEYLEEASSDAKDRSPWRNGLQLAPNAVAVGSG